MRTKTNATKNLENSTLRNENIPTREEILKVISILPMYIEKYYDEIVVENNELETKLETNKNKSNESTSKKTNKNSRKKDDPTPKEIINQINDLKDKLNKMPTMKDIVENEIQIDIVLEKYGSWREIKKLLKEDTTEGKQLQDLTLQLGKVPTMNEVKEAGIDVTNLLLKYGSWKEIKRTLGLYSLYEDKIKNDILELQKTKSISIENCRDANIDVNYLMRNYGSWKKALKELDIKK